MCSILVNPLCFHVEKKKHCLLHSVQWDEWIRNSCISEIEMRTHIDWLTFDSLTAGTCLNILFQFQCTCTVRFPQETVLWWSKLHERLAEFFEILKSVDLLQLCWFYFNSIGEVYPTVKIAIVVTTAITMLNGTVCLFEKKRRRSGLASIRSCPDRTEGSPHSDVLYHRVCSRVTANFQKHIWCVGKPHLINRISTHCRMTASREHKSFL